MRPEKPCSCAKACASPGAGCRTGAIDWSEAWRSARAHSVRRGGSRAWDLRAPSFARHAMRSDYVAQMLALIDPLPSWTVLDVGCGSGTLAVPLAHRISSVTALDFSPRMLDLLGARCAEEGLANVAPVLGSWDDDWAGLGIGTCDVAIASRSLTVDDLGAALLKLDRAARHKVFVTAPVGTGPIDPRVFEAIGRPYVPGPDYIYPLNMLHQLGILATVSFIPVVQARRYASVGAAVDGLSWMVSDPSPDELERLSLWLEQALVPADGGLALSPRTVRWAVLSWSKEELRS